MASKYSSILLVVILAFSLHQKSDARYAYTAKNEKIVKKAIYHYGVRTRRLKRRPGIRLPGPVKPCKCAGYRCKCRYGRRPCGYKCRIRRKRRVLHNRYGYGPGSKRPKPKYKYGYGHYGLKPKSRYRKRGYGYPKRGYRKRGYRKSGYSKRGYPKPGYSKPGYSKKEPYYPEDE